MLRMMDIDLSFPKATELTMPGLQSVWKYLADRGISKEDIGPLGLHILPARDLIAAARGGQANPTDPRLAVVFPHSGADGRTIDWWSARLVDAGLTPRMVTPSFHDAVEARKWGKMFCPPQEAVHAYLVPTQDWKQLKRGDKVYFHESCIKAIAGAKCGEWSIGLNGVRGFSSRKHGVELVEEIRSLPWKALELQPIIVFDSNAADNWDVQHAIMALAARLYEVTDRKAGHLLLPKSPSGDDWGFDDFCVHHGLEAGIKFLYGEPKEVQLSDIELGKAQFNTEFCYVEDSGGVVVQSTGTLLKLTVFHQGHCSDRIAHDTDKKPVMLSRAWMADTRRTKVQKMAYAPGQPRVVPGKFFNTWKGMGLEPQAGDVQPWLNILERQIKDEALRRWVIQWFAYPLQNLGKKINTFLHIYGPQGSGKSAVIEPLMQIYGKDVNAIEVSKGEIEGNFNAIYAERQFINLNEMSGGSESGASAISNKIKMLITSATLVVNKKNQPHYSVDNHAQVVVTTNHIDSIKLDEDDRRACVVQFASSTDQSTWDSYFQWLKSGGASAVYDYLLGVDLTGFNPGAVAPWTESKALVIDAGRDAMTKWVRDLWDDPDSVLSAIQARGVFSNENLAAAYLGKDQEHKNTQGLRNALGQKMAEMGFKKFQIKIEGEVRRGWIVRDRDGDWSNDRIRSEISQIKLRKEKF